MKIALFAILAMLASFRAVAQAPQTVPDAGCRSALLATLERYDLSAARDGRGESVDWIGCAASGTVYTAGAGTFSVADSHWSLARAGASARVRDDIWLALAASAGAGRDPVGSFDYLTTREGVTAKALERLFVRFEHQLIHIATDRGNVYTIAAIVQPVRALLLELGESRSVGGNLGTRSRMARIDWVGERARLFAGAVRGRTVPQAVDIVAMGSLPETLSRQRFGGAAVTFGRAEVLVAYDELRGQDSRRRTLSVNVRWSLP